MSSIGLKNNTTNVVTNVLTDATTASDIGAVPQLIIPNTYSTLLNQLPNYTSGNTAGVPLSLVDGYFYHDTEAGILYCYDGSLGIAPFITDATVLTNFLTIPFYPLPTNIISGTAIRNECNVDIVMWISVQASNNIFVTLNTDAHNIFLLRAYDSGSPLPNYINPDALMPMPFNHIMFERKTQNVSIRLRNNIYSEFLGAPYGDGSGGGLRGGGSDGTYLAGYVLSPTEYNEFNSKIGKTFTLTALPAPITLLDAQRQPVMNSTYFINYAYAGIPIDIVADLSTPVGAKVRFVDIINTSLVVRVTIGPLSLGGPGVSIAGAKDVADYTFTGICRSATDASYFVHTVNAAIGDTVEFEYMGQGVWRVQFFDFVSFADGAIPWSKIDKTGAGATGTYVSQDGKAITVTNGIVTSII